MKTNAGNDLQAQAMADPAADSGTATATSATSLTDSGKAWTVNAWAGKLVCAAGVYGVVASNTATVLTVDKWYTPASPGGAAGTTPGNVAYVICPGNAPAFWIAVTENATAPGATDTSLTAELSGSGWTRAVCTYAHGAGAASYSLSKTLISADGTTRTPAKAAVFNSTTGGRMPFETAIPTPSAMISGDQIALTETVST